MHWPILHEIKPQSDSLHMLQDNSCPEFVVCFILVAYMPTTVLIVVTKNKCPSIASLGCCVTPFNETHSKKGVFNGH